LDNYLFTMKSTIEDPQKLGNKIDSSDKDAIEKEINKIHSWLQSNMDADKDDFEEKLKDL